MSSAVGSAREGVAEALRLRRARLLLLGAFARLGNLRREAVQVELWRQVDRAALDFAGLAALLGALAGGLTIAIAELGLGVGVSIGVRLLHLLILEQFAGFVCALLLVAGPATNAAFELGLMQQRGEVRTLRLIGIDPRDYLVLPRVLGFALGLFVLTAIFQAAAVVGGGVLAALVTPVTFLQQIEALGLIVSPGAVALSAGKSLALGGAVGTLVCQQGLGAVLAPAEMPGVSRRLFLGALVALGVIHGGAFLL